MTSSPSKLITTDEAMRRLGITALVREGKITRPDRLLAKMGRRGEIQVRRVGRFPMVVEESVNKYIEGRA